MFNCNNWNFNWITTWDAVWDPAFVSQWQNMMNHSSDAHVYFEPSLVRAWLNYNQPLMRIEPRFMVATHISGCNVFFPLVYIKYNWKKAWFRSIEPPGVDGFDYHDPIFTKECNYEIISSFWVEFNKEIKKTFDRDYDELIIPRVRDFSIGNYAGFSKYCSSPYINLRNIKCIDELLANGPKSVRQDIRRQERRLEKLGSLHLRIYNQNDINAAREAISGLIFSHNKRWSSDESMAVYLNQLLSECFSEGFLHLSTLESNGSPISWHLGFFHKCRFYYYKIAHDIRFSNYSPGKIHLKKLIEESINQGAYIFDFLRGDESYKYDWTKNEVILYQIKVETTGLCLWSKRNAYKVIEANRNIIKKIRKGLNR